MKTIHILKIATVLLLSGTSTVVIAAQTTTNHSSTNASGPTVHWGYSGAEGPENWGNLSNAYALCKTGDQQSPIDISQVQRAKLVPLSVRYKVSPLTIANNGHTIQVNYAPGSKLKAGLSEYELLQFHFHSPSENQLEGKPYPMEVHFVHKDAKGHIGVLGVFIKQGNKNIVLQEIWDHMPTSAGPDQKVDGVFVSAQDLIPEKQDYVRFVGSLTTPPCSEGVQWHVIKEPIEASREQIEKFLSVIGQNARPPQKIGLRLLIDGSTGSVSAGH